MKTYSSITNIFIIKICFCNTKFIYMVCLTVIDIYFLERVYINKWFCDKNCANFIDIMYMQFKIFITINVNCLKGDFKINYFLRVLQ